MKYRLLSKEQFEELHKEFARFLAAQEIDVSTWEEIKNSEPKKVMTQLENFSDLVWEEVLNNTKYLEHYSEKSINLFHCMPENISRIVVNVEKEGINLQKKEGFEWFMDNSNDKTIQYFKGEKPYTQNRSEELFKLIEEGAVLAEGNLFDALSKIINPSR